MFHMHHSSFAALTGFVSGGALLAQMRGLQKVWNYSFQRSWPLTAKIAQYVKQSYQDDINQGHTQG